MPELDAIIARLEADLGPLEGAPRPLEGGITNRNFRVRLGGEDLVLRLCDHGAEVLGIDRTTEEIASRRAAAAKIAPPVVAFLADVPALVTRWLPGGDVTPQEMRSPRVLGQVAELLRRLHASPALPSAFAVFRIVEQQRELATAVPPSYDDVLALAQRIEAALTDREHDPVPCHNDLLTANFVRDGQRDCIVDWEYAGMNDRLFDLANLSVNNGFSDADDRALLRAYFGDESQLAGLRAMRIVSDLREAAWGLVQAARSDLDVDFATYAREHLERLEGWLAAA
jgi:thiamine kinase-like enzyme